MSTRNIEEVRRGLASFVEAFNREDVDDALSVWAPDFLDMPEGLAAMRGAGALARRREMITERFREHTAVLSIEPAEFAPLGDTAVLVHGELTVTLRRRQTGVVSHLHKRFLEVWVRGPSGWAIQFEMGNSGPPGATASALSA